MATGKSSSACATSVVATLRDGQSVKIRPICVEDEALERDFVERLSPESRHFRFLGGVSKHPADATIKRLIDLDHEHDEAFIALVDEGGRQREIGVARYACDPEGNACECAVVVSDDWQKRGLGTILMQHLIDTARSRGLETMYSIESAENARIREVARALGFQAKTDPDDHTQVIYTLDLRVV